MLEWDLMLSYHWNSGKEYVKQLLPILENAGYKVWYDGHNMTGDMNKAMATGVAKSKIVIPFLSKGYEQSYNCEREYTHAKECKKIIIPVKVENYDPPEDSKLSFIITGKMHYLLYENFQENTEKLLNDIATQLKRTKRNKDGTFHEGFIRKKKDDYTNELSQTSYVGNISSCKNVRSGQYEESAKEVEHDTHSHDSPSQLTEPFSHIELHDQRHQKELAIKRYQTALHLAGSEMIRLSDIMIARKLNENTEINLKNICSRILESILMLNCEGRECHFDLLDDRGGSDSHWLEPGDESDKDCRSDESDEDCNINPLDVFFVLYDACNPRLKQILLEKMFLCKLSVPFVYYKDDGNPVASLWALRSIVGTWRNTNNEIVEKPLINVKVRVVSFMRLGRPGFSKSKFINLLCDTNHKTFYDFDSVRGSAERIVATGVVECSWYLPSKRSKTSFSELITFLNVRGDCRSYNDIFNYITASSSDVFFIVCIEDVSDKRNIETIKRGCKHTDVYLLIVTEKNKVPKNLLKNTYQTLQKTFSEEFCKGNVLFGFSKLGEKKSLSDIKLEFVEKMVKKSRTALRTLEETINIANKFSLTIDESNEEMISAKADAMKLFLLVKNCTKSVKEELTPLQLKLWEEWCQIRRNIYRADKGEITVPKRVLYKRMKEIRNSQYTLSQHALKSNNFFELLLRILHENLHTSETCSTAKVHYFLFWLNHFLGERNRMLLPRLIEKYNCIMDSLRDEKKKSCPDKTQVRKIESQLEETKQTLNMTSFGLEHLVREMGQRYECIIGSDYTERSLDMARLLPEVAAKLLLNGYPLEIMDGNVSHVPLIWVQAVLKYLRSTLGDKCVFILSVTGVQSSGKSTLLNAMFGLELEVSAGRCTKGVFIQLYPVDKTSGFKFDYVLIIDSEGLRAEELGCQKFDLDNELATLCIGLGDLTIVNVKGENIYEIKDVLQIVVLAFLKMKIVNERLNLRQACMFIHQNVGATDAEEKLRHGHRVLQQLLDDMTVEAAEQVHRTNIKSFSDVIHYSSDSHIHYFSDLWYGDPPMAATNPGYSEHVKTVRDWVLNDFSDNLNLFYSINDLGMRIEDLWQGILAQDFIFGFRNSVQIKVYTELEEKLCDLLAKLKEWVEQKKKEMKEVLEECPSSNVLVTQCEKKLQEIRRTLHAVIERLLKDLNDYFESSSYKDILINFKESKVLILRDSEQKCYRKIVEFANRAKQPLLLDIKRREYEQPHHELIMKKAREVAYSLKSEHQISDSALTVLFEKMWSSLSRELNNPEQIMKIDISETVKTVLYKQSYAIHAAILAEMDKESRKYLPSRSLTEYFSHEHIDNTHICLRSSLSKSQLEIHEKEIMRKAFDHSKTILRITEIYLEQLKAQENHFEEEMAQTLFKMIIDGINEFNKDTNNDFTILESLTAKLLVTTCNYAIPMFEDMQIRFEQNVAAKMAEVKNEYHLIFKSITRQTEASICASQLFCHKLPYHIFCKINDLICRTVKSKVCGEFGNTKSNLLKAILVNLAEKNDFDSYMYFVRNAASFAREWIEKYTKEFLFCRGGYYSDISKKETSRTMKILRESVNEATYSDGGCKNMKQWLDLFCKQMKGKGTPVNRMIFVQIKAISNVHFPEFCEGINRRLEVVEERISQYLLRVTAKSLSWENGITPFSEMFEDLWGCPAQCPFCREPCQWTTKHGTNAGHRCLQHKPKGITGRYFKPTSMLEIQNCNFGVTTQRGFMCLGDKNVCKNIDFQDEDHEHYHYYRNYKNCIKRCREWDIGPSPADESCAYWKYFVVKYQKDLENYYQRGFPIPEDWCDITHRNAIESLDYLDN